MRGLGPWDPGAWSPGSPGPGALGSRGPEPWDPGARSLGIPGPGALGSRGPAIPFYTFSSRNRSGIGFLSSRIAENDRLGLGTSKIEVLAKNSKKNKGKWPGKVTSPRPPPQGYQGNRPEFKNALLCTMATKIIKTMALDHAHAGRD